jgi:hypothetical protein
LLRSTSAIQQAATEPELEFERGPTGRRIVPSLQAP